MMPSLLGFLTVTFSQNFTLYQIVEYDFFLGSWEHDQIVSCHMQADDPAD